MRIILMVLALMSSLIGFGHITKANSAASYIMHMGIRMPEYTVSDYVQDSLIALFDGIENSGFREHDQQARVWRNLAGDDEIGLDANDCAIGNNHIAIYAGHQLLGNISALTGTSYGDDIKVTIEVVCSIDEYVTYSPFVQLGFRQLRTYADTNKRLARTEIVVPGRAAVSVSMFTQTKLDLTNINSFSFITSQVPASGIGSNKFYMNALEASINRRNTFTITTPIDQLILGFEQTGSMRVYCIRIYARALTSEEIEYNYLIDKERFGL